MPARARRGVRRIRGLLPWGGHLAWAAITRLLRHPQPLLALGVLGLAGSLLWGFAQRTDAFRIATVQFPSDPPLTLRQSLVGTNLWRVDLRGLAEELQRQQPTLKGVRVVRRLPDALRIEAIPRVPVAQVRLERWHPVDREGILLPGQAAADERLVRLVGVDRANREERLQLGLRILQMLRRTPWLSRRVTELNVAEPTALRLILDGTIEVRCGSEAELDGHLKRLQATLRTVAKQPMDIQYIDLRFQEPVIGGGA